MKEIERVSPKEEFMRQFAETFNEKYLPDSLTKENKEKIAFHTTKGKIKTSMFTSIPMQCNGPSCMFADTCPLQLENIAPIGNACSLELTMVRDFMGDYIEQLDINPDNLIELSQIRDLVDQEVQYIRKSKLLAKEDFIQENVAGIDADGDPIMRKELHLAIDYEDRILKRKAVLLKQLVATREARAKTGQGIIDSAQTMSNLIQSVHQIQRERDDLLKQELGIIDYDEYIEIIPDDDE